MRKDEQKRTALGGAPLRTARRAVPARARGACNRSAKARPCNESLQRRRIGETSSTPDRPCPTIRLTMASAQVPLRDHSAGGWY